MKSLFNYSWYFLVGIFLSALVCCETLTKNYTSFRLYPFCTPTDFMRFPTNADEVVAIVNEAINRGVTVKAFGARHSQTDIICTEGIPVDMNNLKSCQMNSDNVTATFGPGVTIREAGEFILKYGRALRNTAAFGKITLGGAIGTGAHGSTIKYNSTISAQVVRLTVVNGLGEKVVISDPEDLKSFKTNLGLLGIVVDITLFTVPLYKILAHNYVVSDDILTNGVALDWARNAHQITFYWFPSFKEVVVANLTFVPVDTPGNALSNAISPPTYGYFNVIANKAKEIAYKLTSSECAAASALGNTITHVFEFAAESSLWTQTPGSVPIYTEDGVFIKNPAVGYPHLMFGPVCNEDSVGLLGTACFWAHGDLHSNITGLDNELGISLSDLPAFITVAKDIIKKTPTAFPLTGLFLRFSGKSDVYMSTAYDRDTVHIEFVQWKRTNTYKDATGSLAGYQTIMQTMARRFNGRSHWGKSGLVYHNREMLDLKLNPIARQKFVAAMEKFDPNGIFLNNFGRRITEADTDIDFDPLTTRCALLDNCFCSKNSDCGDTQICTSLRGYSYLVCKTKNEVAEIQCDKRLFPPPGGVLDWLLTTVPTLATAVLTKCSLSSVLATVPNLLGSLLG